MNKNQDAGGIRCIWSPADAELLLRDVRESGSVVALDIETEGVDPGEESPVGKGRIACWSLAYYPKDPLGVHSIWGTPLAQKVFIPNWGLYRYTLLLGAFKPFLESDWPKVGQNFTTFDMHVFENEGVRIGGFVGDTLRKSRLLNSTKDVNHGLKFNMYLRFGYGAGEVEELFTRPARLKDEVIEKETKSKSQRFGCPTYRYPCTLGRFSWAKGSREFIPLSTIPEQYPQRMEALQEYSALDAKGTLEWNTWLDDKLAKVPTKLGTLGDLHDKLWNPMMLILNRCERVGFRIDPTLAGEKAELAEVHQREYADNLREWNPDLENWGSYEQLAPFLYDQLKLPTPPIAGTLKSIQKPDTDRPTAEASLYWLELWANKHRHRDIAVGLANLRGWRKTTRSLQDLRKLPLHADINGRVHFMLAPETDTGRLSCRSPNLQAIAGKDRYGLREIFIPSPGHKLVVADYSQLEVYILAHVLKAVFKDDSLENALLGGDIYGTVAKGIWPDRLEGIEATAIKHHPDKVIRALRDHSKVTVLSANYCKGAEGLALTLLDETGEPQPEEYGQELLDGYFKLFPIQQYQQWIARYARDHGYVPTLMGRRRPIPESRSSKSWVASSGDRKAANSPIQGGAADIVGNAMVRLDCGKNRVLHSAGAALVLQVHDELIFEVPDAHAGEVALEVKSQMELDMGLLVQLKAEVKVANSWAAGK